MLKFQTFEISKPDHLNGRKYYSDKITAKKNLIISHGFGASMLNELKMVKPLVLAHYQVFVFNFPQFNGNTGKTSVLTEKQDLIQVVKTVKQASGLKLDLLGCSQGGLVSALVANDFPRLIHKLALFYPAFSIPHDARKGRSELNGIRILPKYQHDAAALQPWRQIRNYKRPVLIVHGTEDQLVNIGYAEKAHSTYKNSKFVTIKHGDHGFHKGFDEAMENLLKFLNM